MTRLSDRLGAIAVRRPPPFSIRFGPWLPDLPDFENPGVTLARNVIPAGKSYRPFPGQDVQSAALDTRALGGAASRDTSSNTYFYAGDAVKLYEIRNQSVTEKQKSGGYSTAAGDVWEFAEYEGQIIATNYTDPVQALTTGGAGLFADLITSTEKPKAKHVGVIRDFLFLGNIVSTADGTKRNRIHWSGFRDGADFDPDATTQSDFNDIEDGGEVQRIIGGVEFGLVFMQRNIQRVSYTGDATVFDIFPIDRKRGTPIPNSALGHGRRAFFISEEGFFFSNGASESQPIGHDGVDRWFWDQFDIGNAPRVSSAIDPANKLACWAFPGEGSVGGAPNRIIIYNWANNRFSYVETDLEIILLSESQAYTLEQLDSVTTDLDALTPSLDSPAWQGGQLKFASFDTAHKLNFFSGANLAATIESGEMSLSPGRHSIATKVRPLVDGSSVGVTAALASRNRLTATASFDTAGSEDSVGEVSQRNDGRYHKVQVNAAAGGTWKHLQGAEITFTTKGTR